MDKKEKCSENLTEEERDAVFEPGGNPEAFLRAMDKALSRAFSKEALAERARLEDAEYEARRLRMNAPLTVDGRLALTTNEDTIIFVDGNDPFEDQVAMSELTNRQYQSSVKIIIVKNEDVTIIDKLRFPLEDEIPEMSLGKLKDFVGNAFWEIPVEYTPNKSQTLRLIELIKARKDADQCGEILKECREYLSLFYPDNPDKKLPNNRSTYIPAP